MMDWSVNDIAALLGGEWIIEPDAAAQSASITGVSIDSRTIQPGEVFVAIAGDRFDGRDYVADAMNAGALLAVVPSGDTHEYTQNKAISRVEDTIKALWTLARAHRARLAGTRVIAVTGSNGKTTTCRLLEAVLSRRLTGMASPRSFNNHIGTPLTILGAACTDEYLICEVGSNSPGEIAALAKLVQPDIGIITNIGSAHLGGFGSVEAIVREKISLVHAV
jgi:UDP-N-acetylmuramoyl-tripeptide--D-alanyl-D-alanine ligase